MNRPLLLYILFYYAATAQGQDVFEKNFTKPEATEIWEPSPKIVT